VRVLAARRDDEGYRAEAVDHGDGSMSLVEHHCAIEAAAAMCGELCESELKVFGKVLDRTTGTKVKIRRVEHLAAGDTCCRYEIRPR
jgi:predicted ArsR family transcriptional regulator